MTSYLAEAQEWEREWWGACLNTFGEEAKQLTYAPRMGLTNEPLNGKWPVYDLQGRSVLDIGGGPCSMLLKTVNGGRLDIVDPCSYPVWVSMRYHEAGIGLYEMPAEGFASDAPYDECWIYNVLQHVESPRDVLETAKRHARILRVFEWLDTPPSPGHPHMLLAPQLDIWINGVNLDGDDRGGKGKTERVDLNGAVGHCYYGVFGV